VFAIASVLLATACENPTHWPRRAPRRRPFLLAEVQAQAAAGPGPMRMASLTSARTSRARTPNGAPISASGCTGGGNQQFALDSAGRLTAYAGGMCVDIAGRVAKNGDYVVMSGCDGAASQRWTRTAAGELRTAVNGRCLDVEKSRVGGRLMVWSCQATADQRWVVNDAMGRRRSRRRASPSRSTRRSRRVSRSSPAVRQQRGA
jgi:hypothetical protein